MWLVSLHYLSYLSCLYQTRAVLFRRLNRKIDLLPLCMVTMEAPAIQAWFDYDVVLGKTA